MLFCRYAQRTVMSLATLDNLRGTLSQRGVVPQSRKMEEAWEEALDLDDSDFQSILRPCNRSLSITTADHPLSQLHSPTSPQTLNNNFPLNKQNPETLVTSQPSRSKRLRSPTQSVFTQPDSFPNSRNDVTLAGSQRSRLVEVPPRSIPGPAGTVLAALRRRRSDIRETESEEEMALVSTQEYLRQAVDGNGFNSEFDNDFKKPTWLAALDFSEREYTELTSCTALSLGAIRSCGSHKLSKVVAMIKSLTSNGFGDFLATLKDPSGTISANIHRSVVTEGNYGSDLSVGAVLVLQKVSVFSPRAECYLNITHNNVVKIFPKDFESMLNSVSGLAVVSECRGSQLTDRGPANQVCNTVGNFGKQSMNEPEALQGNNSTKEAASKSVPSIQKQNLHTRDSTTVLNSSTDINEDCNYVSVLHHEQPAEANKMTHEASANAAESNGANRKMQPSMSLSSLPQWTDEQLEELLVED